jgi:hypothetical protein
MTHASRCIVYSSEQKVFVYIFRSLGLPVQLIRIFSEYPLTDYASQKSICVDRGTTGGPCCSSGSIKSIDFVFSKLHIADHPLF